MHVLSSAGCVCLRSNPAQQLARQGPGLLYIGSLCASLKASNDEGVFNPHWASLFGSLSAPAAEEGQLDHVVVQLQVLQVQAHLSAQDSTHVVRLGVCAVKLSFPISMPYLWTKLWIPPLPFSSHLSCLIAHLISVANQLVASTTLPDTANTIAILRASKRATLVGVGKENFPGKQAFNSNLEARSPATDKTVHLRTCCQAARTPRR